MPFYIRMATKEDSPLILEFIHKIAQYEHMESEVVNTRDRVEEVIFNQNAAKVFLAFLDNQPIGFALFFETYSTFVGEKGIHLEDIFVETSYRGNGYGKALFDAVMQYTLKGNYGRMEWVCLDWNTPAQEFYVQQGAHHMKQWQIFRLTNQEIKTLSQTNF